MRRPVIASLLAILSLPILCVIESNNAGAETDVFLKEYKMVVEAQAVARMFVMTMIHYPENKKECLRRFTIMLSENQLQAGDAYEGKRPGPSFRSLLKRLKEKPYVARSYLQGTSPENGYRLPGKGDTWEMVIKPDPMGNPDPNRVKLFIECTGADSDRPITLVKVGGNIWKVAEASSLFLGVRPPAK